MHIGKMTVNAETFKRQVWKRIFDRSICGIAVVTDQVIDEAEVRFYGNRPIMVMSINFYLAMLKDAEMKYHLSPYGVGLSLAGIPVYQAESVEEFTRISRITKSSTEINALWTQ